MKGNTLEHKLLDAIREALEAMPRTSVANLVDWVRVHHESLIESLQERWINDRLTTLCRAEIQRQNPMRRGRPTLGHPRQARLKLPEFENIPYQFSVGGKRRVRLPSATVEDLGKRLALIKDEFTAEASDLKRLIAFMEPYDKAQPGITVRAALKLQAAKRRVPKQA